MQILRMPLDYISRTQNFSTSHYAVDLAWNKYQGEPVYACMDGKVLQEFYDPSGGNMIVLQHELSNNTVIVRFMHLKERALVKAGQSVKQGQTIGYMGTTGDSTGTHLHFELWLCPKGYTYKNTDRARYAVNPFDYVYLFENQVCSSKEETIIRKAYGNPIARNVNSNQLEIVVDNLRCRKTPNGEILGIMVPGIYNYLETKVNGDYTWYKIAENRWCAYQKEWIKLYPKVTETNEEKLEKIINEQKQQIEQLNNQIVNLKNEKELITKENETLKKQLKEYEDNTPRLIFECPTDGYYFMKLEESDKLYILSK